MSNIPVYQSELAVAGLAEKVRSANSIALYNHIFSLPNNPNEVSKTIANLVVASEHDYDLYRSKSILVTTNWNKNDDVFVKNEVWSARKTPSHKPTNLDHDEHKLVGHITDTWAISTDGTIIPDSTNTEDLPDVYHVVNGAVIYKGWSDPKLIERTEALIADIESGEMFVSMECLFTNFDYAIINDDGSVDFKVRDEATAFLTKHLRAYGGTGEWEGSRIGRVLRNITFSGKGYVKKPANPDSIIFNSPIHHLTSKSNCDKQNSDLDNAGVSLDDGGTSPVSQFTEETKLMSAELTAQNDKLKAQVTELQTELASVKAKLAEISVDQFTTEITELKAKIAELTEQAEANAQTISESAATIDSLKQELTDTVAAKANLEKTIEEVRAAELTAKRISTLVDGGMNKETATEHVATFSNLTDEQFNVLANTLISTISTSAAEVASDDGDDDNDEVSTASADTSVLDNATTSSETVVNVSDDAQQAELAEARILVQEAIATLLGKQTELDKSN